MHVNDLGAEGLQDLLHDRVPFGALAHASLLAPRLVFGRDRFVVYLTLTRRSDRDGDADAAAQYLTAHLAQQALVLRPPQSVVQVLPLRRELDAHVLALEDNATRAFDRHGEQRLAALFELLLDATDRVARLFMFARRVLRDLMRACGFRRDRGPRAARGRLRSDERDRLADSILARGRLRRVAAERERCVVRARGRVARKRRRAA